MVQKSFCVSVIVPVYNHQHYLDRCLASVEAQTLGGIEVIVVDDGSDTPVFLPREYGIDHLCLIRHANQGLSSARNTGLEQARGRYIKFLDADDELLPHCLEDQVRILAGYPHGALAATGFHEVREEESYPVIPSFSDAVSGLLRVNLGPPHIFLYPSAIRDQGYRFSTEDRTHGGHEDYDFVFRLAVDGWKFLSDHSVGVRYYKYKNSMSADSYAMERTRTLVWLYHVRRMLEGYMPLPAPRLAFSILVNYLYLLDLSHPDFVDDLVALEPNLCDLLERTPTVEGYHDWQTLMKVIERFPQIQSLSDAVSRRTDSGTRNPHPQENCDLYLRLSALERNALAGDIDDVLAFFRAHNEDVAIYGAGQMGRKLFNLLAAHGLKPAYFIDKKAEKLGKLGDCMCFAPKALADNPTRAVIIASKAYRSEIIEEIRALNTAVVIFEP